MKASNETAREERTGISNVAKDARSSSSFQQLLTIIGISCIAAFLSIEGHELLGHGVAGYLFGARSFQLIPADITFRLPDHTNGTSVGRFVSAAGALYNFIAGFLFYIAFRRSSRFNPNIRYFYWLLTTLNAFDLPSYMLFSALTKQGDWEVVVHGLPHEAIVRVVMVCGSIVVYALLTRAVAFELGMFTDTLHTLALTPYFVSIAIYCLAASLSLQGRSELLVSALPANAIGNIGLLLVAPWATRLRARSESRIGIMQLSVPWLVTGLCSLMLLLRIGAGIAWSM